MGDAVRMGEGARAQSGGSWRTKGRSGAAMRHEAMQAMQTRMGAAEALFGGDAARKDRVLSAFSAHRPHTSNTGLSRASRVARGRVGGLLGHGEEAETPRRMRAMMKGGGTAESGSLGATGKLPGDYWWEARGPGIRRQRNYERQAGHYPVVMAMPAMMPQPKGNPSWF